jgi:hypothetical protein
MSRSMPYHPGPCRFKGSVAIRIATDNTFISCSRGYLRRQYAALLAWARLIGYQFSFNLCSQAFATYHFPILLRYQLNRE